MNQLIENVTEVKVSASEKVSTGDYENYEPHVSIGAEGVLRYDDVDDLFRDIDELSHELQKHLERSTRSKLSPDFDGWLHTDDSGGLAETAREGGEDVSFKEAAEHPDVMEGRVDYDVDEDPIPDPEDVDEILRDYVDLSTRAKDGDAEALAALTEHATSTTDEFCNPVKTAQLVVDRLEGGENDG